MIRQKENEIESLKWFLHELHENRCTTELWNQFVIGAYKDQQAETIRTQLFQKALAIGQCAGEPFPPFLRHFAGVLLDEL